MRSEASNAQHSFMNHKAAPGLACPGTASLCRAQHRFLRLTNPWPRSTKPGLVRQGIVWQRSAQRTKAKHGFMNHIALQGTI